MKNKDLFIHIVMEEVIGLLLVTVLHRKQRLAIPYLVISFQLGGLNPSKMYRYSLKITVDN